MKKIAILVLSVLAMVSCSNTKNSMKAIGGDKDKHGCIGAAGQSWSELKGECIQIFNVGQRLNPVQTKEGQSVISAFVLFNTDKSKLELFLDGDDNVILNKSEKNIYQNGKYRFNSTESTLYINGKKAYQAEK